MEQSADMNICNECTDRASVQYVLASPEGQLSSNNDNTLTNTMSSLQVSNNNVDQLVSADQVASNNGENPSHDQRCTENATSGIDGTCRIDNSCGNGTGIDDQLVDSCQDEVCKADGFVAPVTIGPNDDISVQQCYGNGNAAVNMQIDDTVKANWDTRDKSAGCSIGNGNMEANRDISDNFACSRIANKCTIEANRNISVQQGYGNVNSAVDMQIDDTVETNRDTRDKSAGCSSIASNDDSKEASRDIRDKSACSSIANDGNMEANRDISHNTACSSSMRTNQDYVFQQPVVHNSQTCASQSAVPMVTLVSNHGVVVEEAYIEQGQAYRRHVQAPRVMQPITGMIYQPVEATLVPVLDRPSSRGPAAYRPTASRPLPCERIRPPIEVNNRAHSHYAHYSENGLIYSNCTKSTRNGVNSSDSSRIHAVPDNAANYRSYVPIIASCSGNNTKYRHRSNSTGGTGRGSTGATGRGSGGTGRGSTGGTGRGFAGGTGRGSAGGTGRGSAGGTGRGSMGHGSTGGTGLGSGATGRGSGGTGRDSTGGIGRGSMGATGSCSTGGTVNGSSGSTGSTRSGSTDGTEHGSTGGTGSSSSSGTGRARGKTCSADKHARAAPTDHSIHDVPHDEMHLATAGRSSIWTDDSKDVLRVRSYMYQSGSSAVAIDNKIEQAMDLVKSHLMFAVREEVEVLKEQIADLIERNNQLEYENGILRAGASPETLALLAQPRQPPPATSS